MDKEIPTVHFGSAASAAQTIKTASLCLDALSPIMSNLNQLVKLISDSFSALQKSAADVGLPLPNLDDKWTPESEAFRRSPERAELANVIAAAAFQLAATLTPVEITLYEIAGGVCFLPS